MVSIARLRSGLHDRLLSASHRVESLARRKRMGTAGPTEAQIISDLTVEGVHVTSIEQLMPTMAEAIRESFQSAQLILREGTGAQGSNSLWSRGSSSLDLKAEVLLTRVPMLYTLGLEPRMLMLVRHYLRLPVAYHGAVVRHSFVDGAGAGPRLWHMDDEDFHVFRMVIYMNDVTTGGGPFEYIPRRLGVSYRQVSGPERLLSNEQMDAIVPRTHWKRVYGPAGTVVICDTAQTFHHESLQTERERSVVMIGYSSRRPKGLKLAMAHFPVEHVRPILASVVPSSNYDHVFAWRREVLADA